MAFRRALALLLSFVALASSTSQFKSVECKYKLAAVPELSSSSKALELGVYAGEDFERKGILEKQPAALFKSEDCAASILNNYVHGHNLSHATFFFGASSVFNHGEKNLVHNAVLSHVVGKYGSPDVSLLIGEDVKQGEEMFGYYNVKKKTNEETILVVDWFKDRKLPYVNTSDKETYNAVLRGDSLILDGCADNDHLKLNSTHGGVWAKLGIKEGDVVETNRALFVYNRIGTEDEDGRLDDAFWNANCAKKVLSLGIILPFAKFSSDPSVANVKPEWWKDQVFYQEEVGVISLVATRDIASDEEIIVLSNSYYYKQLPYEMSSKITEQISWPTYFYDLYHGATVTGMMYASMILGFGFLFLIT